jgi:hypothetical protein
MCAAIAAARESPVLASLKAAAGGVQPGEFQNGVRWRIAAESVPSSR